MGKKETIEVEEIEVGKFYLITEVILLNDNAIRIDKTSNSESSIEQLEAIQLQLLNGGHSIPQSQKDYFMSVLRKLIKDKKKEQIKITQE